MIWRCAWCEKEKPEDERDHDDNITHGICGPHLVELRAEIAERRAQQEATT